jgi:ABC-2 type transport system permease protein
VKNVWIVLVAEVKRRLTSRAFQIGVVIGMLGVAGMSRIPSFVASHVGGDQTAVVLAGAPALTARAAGLLGGAYKIAAIQTSTEPPTAADLTRLHAGQFIVLTTSARGVSVAVYAKSSQNVPTERIAGFLAPLNLEVVQRLAPAQSAKLLTVPVTVHAIGDVFATPQSAAFAHVIAFSLLFVLYLIIILNSQLTLNSVIEEKTNRIAELLVAAIDPLALLYGKIGAGIVLAAIQMLAWLFAGFAATALGSGSGGGVASPGVAGAASSLLAMHDAFKPLIVPAFLFLLLVGLLQFSTLYAAIGSLVSRPEDLGSLSSALILPIVGAFVMAMLALDAPDAPLVVAASFVPLIAPFVMFVRVVMSNPPAWQLALCAVINVATLWAFAVGAGRLYRVGMLLYGRPPSLAQVWKTVRER